MDVEVIIERHEQQIKALQREMSAMKEVQAEIRSMNETLVTLANELKHTNEHLARHERKIEEIDAILKTNNDKTENKIETPSTQSSDPAVTTTDFHKGDLVSIAKNATYYSGKNVPSWVKSQKWYIKEEPKGNRVVIDKNEKGTNSICSPIHKKYLTLVRTANQSTSSTVKTETESKCPYLAKVTANSLTIRKGAGTNTAKVGAITDKGTYTVVEERNGTGASMWGKLKSGAGWISLDYVKKV